MRKAIFATDRIVGLCPHCQHTIRQSDGYRYFLGKLLCDPCYTPFVQNWKRKQSQLKVS